MVEIAKCLLFIFSARRRYGRDCQLFVLYRVHRCYLFGNRYVTVEAEERNPFHSTQPIELRRIENTRIISSGSTSPGMSSLTSFKRQISLFDFSKYLKGSATDIN